MKKTKNDPLFAAKSDKNREQLAAKLLQNLPATQEALAEELGLTRPHLLEVLEYLERQKKIVRVDRVWRVK